jgi:hypothetical protein
VANYCWRLRLSGLMRPNSRLVQVPLTQSRGCPLARLPAALTVDVAAALRRRRADRTSGQVLNDSLDPQRAGSSTMSWRSREPSDIQGPGGVATLFHDDEDGTSSIVCAGLA